jgi:hypothetical protein
MRLRLMRGMVVSCRVADERGGCEVGEPARGRVVVAFSGV